MLVPNQQTVQDRYMHAYQLCLQVHSSLFAGQELYLLPFTTMNERSSLLPFELREGLLKNVMELRRCSFGDAFEWVELPNVSGMVLFADGGYLASKPYAAGGAYINRMSNYCQNCRYKVAEKTGSDACPFNYLYWHFLIRNRDKLGNNARLGMIYRSLDRMSEDKQQTIMDDAGQFLNDLV